MSFLPGFFPAAASATIEEIDAMAKLLTSGEVSNAATLDIVLSSYTGYRAMMFRLDSFVPATNDVGLYLRTSSNGGASYEDGAGAYRWTSIRTADPDASVGKSGSSSDTKIEIVPVSVTGVSNNASTGGVDMNIYFAEPMAARYGSFSFNGSWFSSTNGIYTVNGAACRVGASSNAVRFLFESGNIASGKYAVYGML